MKQQNMQHATSKLIYIGPD